MFVKRNDFALRFETSGDPLAGRLPPPKRSNSFVAGCRIGPRMKQEVWSFWPPKNDHPKFKEARLNSSQILQIICTMCLLFA